MEKILFINGCVRPGSRTLRLAKRLLGVLGGEVTEVDLGTEDIRPMDGALLEERDRLSRVGEYADPLFRYARQFARADTVVLAAPYWDLSFPALVKAYLESVTVTGVTFRYTEEGAPQGLCRGKRLFYVTTAGGPFLPDYGFEYAKALAQGFFGIRDVYCIYAEGLDIVGNDAEAILAEAERAIDALR